MSPATAAIVLFCLAAGLGGAVQAAVMGRFGERIGTLEAFAFSTFLTALVAAGVLVVGRQAVTGYADGARSPVWLWTAALMSALVVLASTVAAPRIGTTATIALFIGGNLVMAAVIDRFGLFGLERIPLDRLRLLGIALLAAGAALTLRK